MDYKNRSTSSLSLSTAGWLAFASIFFTGCVSNSAFDSSNGHFEGFLAYASSTNPSQTAVSADVIKNAGGLISVKMVTEPENSEIDFDFQMNGGLTGSTNVVVSSKSGFITAPITLNSSGSGCFTSAQKDQLCLSGKEITLSLSAKGAKFVLDQMAKVATPVLETPANYTIDQLMQRAKTNNFDNQVEFQTVMQAKLTAKTAELNLLPHININSALDLEPFAFETAIRAIGDIVPFILPTRWFQVAELKDQSQADVDAYKLVQAGSMNTVQGLALAVLRDEQIIQTLQENEINIILVRDEILVQIQHSAGDLQVGAGDQIDLVLDQLDSSIASLKETLQEEKVALSQGASFVSGSAVALVEPISLPTVSSLSFLSKDPAAKMTWEKMVRDRSVELVQLDHLVEAAHAMTKEKSFEWLDPAGDDQGSIGFGLITHIEVGKSAVTQLLTKRTQAEQQLMGQIDNALSDAQSLNTSYRIAVSSSETGQNIIDRLTSDLQNGVAFDMTELATGFQTKAESDVNQVTDKYALQIIQAELDYLTFSNAYATLLSN